MNTKYNKLKCKIAEVYGSQEIFAKRLKVAPMTVSRHLNGQTSFKRDEIMRWAGCLSIPKEEIILYFFDD